jgi:hypothetical protein
MGVGPEVVAKVLVAEPNHTDTVHNLGCRILGVLEYDYVEPRVALVVRLVADAFAMSALETGPREKLETLELVDHVLGEHWRRKPDLRLDVRVGGLDKTAHGGAVSIDTVLDLGFMLVLGDSVRGQGPHVGWKEEILMYSERGN